MFGIAGILNGMNLPSQISGAIRGLLDGPDQRQAFVAVLLATVTNVQNKPNFNLELEINDLWTRMGALRAAGGGGMADQINQTLGQVTQAMNAMNQQQKTMNDIMLQLIVNMR